MITNDNYELPKAENTLTPQLTEKQILDMQEEQEQEYADYQQSLIDAERDMESIPQYTHAEAEAYAAAYAEEKTRETILRVIMGAHNGKEILARVAEIQAGLWVAPFAPTAVKVSASEKRRMANDGGNWVEIMVPVLEVDPYSLDAPYFIKYPNGETDWVKGR